MPNPLQQQVSGLFRYPVKSMLAEQLSAVAVGLRGLDGDRAYAVVDRADGRVASGKHPRKRSRLVELSAAFVDEPTAALTPPVVITFPDATASVTVEGSLAVGDPVTLTA